MAEAEREHSKKARQESRAITKLSSLAFIFVCRFDIYWEESSRES
jgi:hypothetical protein